MPPTVVSQGNKLKISCGNPAHKTKLVSLSTWTGSRDKPQWIIDVAKKYNHVSSLLVWGMEAGPFSSCCPPRDLLVNGHYNGLIKYHAIDKNCIIMTLILRKFCR